MNAVFLFRLIAACAFLSSPLKSFSQEITVMTFNIYHGEKNYEPGKSNLQQIAEVIREVRPDFVALQEVDSLTQRTSAFNQGVPQDLVKELAGLTGMYGYFGKAIDYSGGGYGEGILSRFRRKQPFISCRHRWAGRGVF